MSSISRYFTALLSIRMTLSFSASFSRIAALSSASSCSLSAMVGLGSESAQKPLRIFFSARFFAASAFFFRFTLGFS